MPRNSALLLAASVLLLTGAGSAYSGEAPAAKVEKSSAAAATSAASLEPRTIAEVYNGVGARDPFISVLGSGGAAPASDAGEAATAVTCATRSTVGRWAWSASRRPSAMPAAKTSSIATTGRDSLVDRVMAAARPAQRM